MKLTVGSFVKWTIYRIVGGFALLLTLMLAAYALWASGR
jgi:hypothetical protein